MSRGAEFIASWGDRLRVGLGEGPGYIGVLSDRQAQEIDTFSEELEAWQDAGWIVGAVA